MSGQFAIVYLFISIKLSTFSSATKKMRGTLPVFLHFEMLQQCDSHKVLGVIFDKNLSFKAHINEICNKLSRSIALIYNLKNYMPIEVLKTIYYAHVHPHLTYCLPIWGSTYPSHLQSIFLLQKRALRLITNSPFLEHTNPLFKLTKIIKFYDLVKLEIASYMFKCKHLPLFDRLIHGYNTRHRNNLIPPIHALTLFKNSLQYNGPSIWNSIPQHLKSKRNLTSFRTALKRLMISNY